jgi:hypothetical protein
MGCVGTGLYGWDRVAPNSAMNEYKILPFYVLSLSLELFYMLIHLSW